MSRQIKKTTKAVSEIASKAIILNTTEIAAFFSVTTRSVQNWAAAGCQQEGRGSWNLKAVHDWWWENIAQDRALSDAGDESMAEAKRKYWWQKAEAEETKNQQAKGQLVAWADIEREWTGRLVELTTGLQCLIDRLPPLLDGKSRNETRAIIETEILSLRDAYARDGKYCKK